MTKKAIKKAVVIQKHLHGDDYFDESLEPHTLTDKTDTKVVPCRTCKRPCVVTRFATAAKVACEDHRERKAKVTAVTEFNDKLEKHVLTDREETKDVPCTVCGRRCVVTTFAAPAKVRCNEHRKHRPRKSTKIVADGNGRARERTTVNHVTSLDLEWSDFIIAMPELDTREFYTDDERHQKDTMKAVRLATDMEWRKLLRKFHANEGQLLATNTSEKVATKLEQENAELEPQILSLQLLVTNLRAEEDQIAHVAWVRAARADGWKVKDHTLTKGYKTLTLPSDYLDDDHINAIKETR